MSLFGNKHSLDYCGQKDRYKRARDKYRAGANVKLYYYVIGTDTDYAFYLNKERLNVLYSRLHGYVVKFKMPDADSRLICSATNSMYRAERKDDEGI